MSDGNDALIGQQNEGNRASFGQKMLIDAAQMENATYLAIDKAFGWKTPSVWPGSRAPDEKRHLFGH